MRDFLYRLVLRLHDEERPLSRNKHFHVFTGEARKALRIDRHLRDLEGQLGALRERGVRPRVVSLPLGGVRLVLRDLRFSVVRTATLSADEAALLARHPAGAWALGEADTSGEDAPLAAVSLKNGR
jgi:hypothetical protein